MALTVGLSILHIKATLCGDTLRTVSAHNVALICRTTESQSDSTMSMHTIIADIVF